nr:MAG TPA: hypothetical protein [Caudoviricetes sp.]
MSFRKRAVISVAVLFVFGMLTKVFSEKLVEE